MQRRGVAETRGLPRASIMPWKLLLTALCYLSLRDGFKNVNATPLKTSKDFQSAVSVNNLISLFKDAPMAIYASAVPHGSYSFHAPVYQAPGKTPTKLIPVRNENLVIQKQNGFLTDSYGNKFLETPQSLAYKTVFPQQFVSLQDLPAHLSQPFVAASPGYHFKQSAPQFSYGTPIRLPTQALHTRTHIPLVYAGKTSLLATPIQAQFPNVPVQVSPIQQSTNQKIIFSNRDSYKQFQNLKSEPVKFQRLEEKPKTVTVSHETKNQNILPTKAALLNAQPTQELQSQEFKVTADNNGQKTIVSIPADPSLLDLSLLEPLVFDNPIVPQVQHFLPKVTLSPIIATPPTHSQQKHKDISAKNTKYYDDSIKSEKGENKKDGHRYNYNEEVSHRPPVSEYQDITPNQEYNDQYNHNIEVSHRQPVSEYKDVTPNKEHNNRYNHNIEVSHRQPVSEYKDETPNKKHNNRYNYNKEVSHRQPVSHNKDITPKQEHNNRYNHNKEVSHRQPVSEYKTPNKAYNDVPQRTNKENYPGHGSNFNSNGKNEGKNNGNDEEQGPKHLIYHGDFEEEDEYPEDHSNYSQNNDENSSYENSSSEENENEQRHPHSDKYQQNTRNQYNNEKSIAHGHPEKYYNQQKTAPKQYSRVTIPKNSNFDNYPKFQSIQEYWPPMKAAIKIIPKPNSYVPPRVEQKFNRIIIKEEPPVQNHNFKEEMIAEVIKEQENNENDFDKAYKNAAIGFSSFNKDVDAEKEIYNPASYGVPRYHEAYDIENSPFQQYFHEPTEYPKSSRLTYKEMKNHSTGDYFKNYHSKQPKLFKELAQLKQAYVNDYKAYRDQDPYNFISTIKKQKTRPESIFERSKKKKENDDKHFAKYKVKPFKHDFDYSKVGEPRDNFPYDTKLNSNYRTQFVEPQFQYGFAPIPKLLESELAAMASNDSPESETPGSTKKIYKENWYIHKTSTAGKT